MSATGPLLGVDYGTVRVGLAVSDSGRTIAFPLEVYTRRGADKDAGYFRELVKKEDISELIVGLPLHTNGAEGAKAIEARGYGDWLAKVCDRPVTLWDERFTTVMAEDLLWEAGLSHKRRQSRRDKVAAQILLQSFLDARPKA